MLFDKVLLIAVLEIAVFLFGYAIGRRVGKREGITEGMSLLPLDLKKQLYETSICPLCSQQLNTNKNCDKIHNRD
ncbi:MAG TPA: hypothetical protein GX514_05165 [Thermoanaerobacterales bacterium]|uniref:hypothetical protein n=1 Tax=Tepidanaerobacter sp. GT38 TaxID=2722793 RepID=UPI0017967FFE|nr:hypothetical protein [Tepidanaerobacter sp. GT38]MCG1011989.1 hypothetical protein [Tepidanaerobacter sp. GT38]HHY42219.1 hypothetical protein [Thermoanaerobacterales bacterium]